VTVHVVIVNWNGCADTLRCLESLSKSSGIEHAIHVVDNGSTDGSVAAIRAAWPEATVQEFDDNRGFAAAANAGMRAALADGAEFVFLLNNDATVLPDTLACLGAAAARRPEAGLYSGKIYRDLEARRLWCCGVSMGWHFNLCRLRGFGKIDRGAFDAEQVVDSLTGCGLLISRRVVETVGYLDEDFWVYVEDADYCARAQQMGFSCLYVPDAVMEHRGAGSTGGGYTPARKYLTAYGSARFIRKHGLRRMGLTLCLLFFDLLPLPLLFLKASLTGTLPAALAKWRGLRHGLRGRPVDRGCVEI